MLRRIVPGHPVHPSSTLGGLYNAPDQPGGGHYYFHRGGLSRDQYAGARAPPARAASSASALSAPQNDQQQVPESSQTLKVQTNLVNVFVTARDKKNAVLTDLKQEDFKIYEDGVEQKVAFFSKDMNLPITLAILIDTSGSMQNILGAEQDAASRFVKTVMRKKDEAMVISFRFRREPACGLYRGS